MAEPSRKKRRTSKACDACHARKTKCYWRYPRCVDCIRLHIDCTFARHLHTRSTRRSSTVEVPVDQPSSSTGSSRVDDVEETNPFVGMISRRPGVEEPSKEQERTQAPCNEVTSLHGFFELHSKDDLDNLIERYFCNINHLFPLFSKERFLSRMHAFSGSQTSTAVSVNAMLASVLQKQYMSDSANASSQLQRAIEYKMKATSLATHLITASPKLHIVQALTCTAALMEEIQSEVEQAATLLAPAVQMAYTLRLHQLDAVTGISFHERLDKLRIFWCLYILDQSISMRNLTPPMINSDDICTLEPKMFSDDNCGLISSLSGSRQLNLFAARQRLSKIESKTWARLWTFKARHQPHSCRLAAENDLRVQLMKWKIEWFDYGDVSELPRSWPNTNLLDLVRLQFDFFRCVLRASPDLPHNSRAVKQYAETCTQASRHLALPEICVGEARVLVRIASLMRKAGLAYLCESMQYVVPAIAILLGAIISGLKEERSIFDLTLGRYWLNVLEYVVEKAEDRELEIALQACQKLESTASATI